MTPEKEVLCYTNKDKLEQSIVKVMYRHGLTRKELVFKDMGSVVRIYAKEEK